MKWRGALREQTLQGIAEHFWQDSGLYLVPVGADHLQLFVGGLVLLLLLDGRDDPPGRATRPDDIFVGHRELSFLRYLTSKLKSEHLMKI